MYGKSSYNPTYEKLVSNKTDYIGMVAYSLYKRELQQHLKSGKEKQSFIEVHNNNASRARYKKEAQGLINTFLQINIDNNLSVVKEPLIKEIQNLTRVSIKPLRKRDRFLSWHNSGLGGFVPTFWKTVGLLLIFYSPLFTYIETIVVAYIKTH